MRAWRRGTSSRGAGIRERAPRLGAISLGLFAGLASALLLAGGPGGTAVAAVSPGSQTFTYSDGEPKFFRVPAGVHYIAVTAKGGDGGGGGAKAALGGRAGVVKTVLPVTPGDELHVWVGGYGSDGGGYGNYAYGGSGGKVPGISHQRSGDGGGGSSGIGVGFLRLAGVIAGGGGGGGGNAEDPALGGAGGNGGLPAQGGFPGSDQGGGTNVEGLAGGCGGCSSKPDGADGQDTGDFGINGGGGGGGGGGRSGGLGGDSGIYRVEQVDPIGGSGGGGGSSYVMSGALNTKYSVNAHNCDEGSPHDACYGRVSLSWGQPPAAIAISSGDAQSVPVGSRFAPLAVKVTDSDGIPVAGAKVRFILPDSGPGGTFPVYPHYSMQETKSDGIATSPTLIANGTAGRWNAQAYLGTDTDKSVSFSLANTAAKTRTVVSTSPDRVIYGQGFAASALVSSSSVSERPRGRVRFEVDGDPVGDAVAVDAGGRAEMPGSALPALEPGGHTVEADFLGDSGHDPSSGTRAVQVAKATSAIRFATDPNPSSAGQLVRLSAAVSGWLFSSGTPTGTVGFKTSGGLQIGTVQLDGDGEAELSTTALPAGSTDLIATYSGDEHFTGATGRATQGVGPEATATELSSSINPMRFGMTPSWTARVIRSDQGAALHGTVTFSLGGETICPAVALDAEGSAACSPLDWLDAGTRTVRADYLPPAGSSDDPSHALMDQVVAPGESRLSLGVAPEPGRFGDGTALTGSVQVPGSDFDIDGGRIAFSADGAALGAPVPVESASATEDVACSDRDGCPFTAGTHIVEADFSAAGGNLEPDHAAALHAVEPARTELALSASESPAVAGRPVAFTAGVSAPAGAGRPFGRVQFAVDGQALGEAVPLQGGRAVSIPVATLTPGGHRITADYLGSGPYAPSRAGIGLSVGPRRGDVGTPTLSFDSSSARVDGDGSVRLPVSCYGEPGAACSGLVVIRSTAKVRLARRGSHPHRRSRARRGGRANNRSRGFRVLPAGRLLTLRNVWVPAGGTVRAIRFDLNNLAGRVLSRMGSVAARAKLTPDPGTALMSPHDLRLASTRAPAVKLRGGRATLRRGRRLILRVRCRARRGERCRVRARLRLSGKGRGHGRGRVGGHRTGRVVVRVDRGLARRLRSSGRIRARVRLRSTVEVGRDRASGSKLVLSG